MNETRANVAEPGTGMRARTRPFSQKKEHFLCSPNFSSSLHNPTAAAAVFIPLVAISQAFLHGRNNFPIATFSCGASQYEWKMHERYQEKQQFEQQYEYVAKQHNVFMLE